MELAEFFSGRTTAAIAQSLLGKKLIYHTAQADLSGWIVETEAYLGQQDSTASTIMFPVGTLFFTFLFQASSNGAVIYLICGVIWLIMLTIVTQNGHISTRTIGECEKRKKSTWNSISSRISGRFFIGLLVFSQPLLINHCYHFPPLV